MSANTTTDVVHSASLGRVFLISVTVLTAIAGIALALGDENPFPVVMTPGVCLVSYLVATRWPSLQLSAAWGNSLGVIALFLAVAEFWDKELLGRLLAGAHFLVYLTWIVLFQQKTVSQYWLLLALGLLQIAVGAVLTISGWFGLLLMSYMLLAVWTISVFSLYQGQIRFAGEARRGTQLVEGTTGRSVVRNSVQLDPTEQWLSPRFVGGILSVGLLGLTLGMVFFLFVPRFWVGGMNVLAQDATSPLATRALTGFREEVTLADIGTLLDNSQTVLRVHARDHNTNAPGDLLKWLDSMGDESVLFRGTVFEDYSRDAAGRGVWSAEKRHTTNRQSTQLPSTNVVLALEIEQEPIGTDIVFAVWPLTGAAWRREGNRAPFRRSFSDVLFLDERPTSTFKYTIYLPVARRPEYPLGPGVSQLAGVQQPHRFLVYPEKSLPRLRPLAREVLRKANLPREPKEPLAYLQARALEAHLKSGEYEYSRATAPKDPGIDPIEDFLFNRKAGHCQYYAAALTLMLRSVGIHSRMVNGFKGVDLGAKPGDYVVQQRHAHAWVEAWIPQNPNHPILEGGEWITLDPTPAARDLDVQATASTGENPFQTARDTLSELWNSYIVGLTIDRQQQSFFTPLAKLLRTVVQAFSEDGALAIPKWIWLLLTEPELWLSWQGAATVALLLSVLWGLYFGLRAIARRLGRWAGRGQSRRTVVRIEFYERFARLLEQRGLHRDEAQTPQEFSTMAARVLHPQLTAAGLVPFFPQLVDAFYQVRFGDVPLSPQELNQLSAQLDQLEACLRPA